MTSPPKPNRGLLHRFLFGDNARFLKFAMVGISGVLVNEGLLWLCTELFFTPLPHDVRILVGGAVAIGGSIFTNFLLNDVWTWGDREKLGTTHFFTRLGK